MRNDEIAIRSIQHYLYCPHRWGLLEIDCAWSENAFVTKANIMHNRVHDPDRKYISKGKHVLTAVSVYNDLPQYNLYGVVDCLELTEDSDGQIVLGDNHKKYDACIVEYKPTKPKNMDYNEDDLMQVFAQKICVDYIFGCNCKGMIYYADVKKRIKLPLAENYEVYNDKLKKILTEMRNFLGNGTIPTVRIKQKCSGCSMKDMCMPKIRECGNIKTQIKMISESQL